MKSFPRKKAVLAIVTAAVLLFSILAAGRLATSPDFHAKTLASLSEKQNAVLELAAASTATAAAISLIPGDAATPIADKLADLSGGFLLVLCAIYLEKFLLLLTGYASFYFLIPLACLLFFCYLAKGWEGCQALARKLFLFALVIVLVIPASVKFSDLMEETHRDSIAATIQYAEEAGKEAKEAAKDGNVISKIADSITNAVSSAVEKASRSVNQFLESLAILLVTSCVIPILVLLFFVWFIKAMFSAPLLTRPALPAARKADAAEREREEVL